MTFLGHGIILMTSCHLTGLLTSLGSISERPQDRAVPAMPPVLWDQRSSEPQTRCRLAISIITPQAAVGFQGNQYPYGISVLPMNCNCRVVLFCI